MGPKALLYLKLIKVFMENKFQNTVKQFLKVSVKKQKD